MKLRDWLKQGPYTLALSSGFFGFFAHFGALAALEKNNLLPNRISGSSAGALAGACWASGCPITNIQNALARLTKNDFWDPALGLGLLKGQLFRDFIQTLCPVSTIEDCLIPLSISAFDLHSVSTHVLDYGSLSNSVYASCTVPLLFQPIRIGNGLYFDGGVKDRAGLAGTRAENRILHHHLQSQWPPLFCHLRESNILTRRPNMISVVIRKLETVGPNRLQNGKKAYQQAETAFVQALKKPVDINGIFV